MPRYAIPPLVFVHADAHKGSGLKSAVPNSVNAGRHFLSVGAVEVR
jgi:hypothetical protein